MLFGLLLKLLLLAHTSTGLSPCMAGSMGSGRNNSLYATLVKICISIGAPLSLSSLLKCTTTTSLCSHSLFDLHKHSANVDDCQWVPFFPHEGVQWHNFPSYALPCHTPFCQTTPLLPSVAQQQNVMQYWWEGSPSAAIPPTSTSDIVSQHNNIRGLTFGAALVSVLLE